MINKYYNIIIYAHFVQRVVFEHFKAPLEGVESKSNLLATIELPNHAIEYLEEKANRFNLSFNDFELDELLDKRYLEPLSDLLPALFKVFDKISNESNIDFGESDPVSGIMLRMPRVKAGADHWLGQSILSYIDDIQNLTEIKRDLQIKTLEQ